MIKAKQIKILDFPGKLYTSILTVLQTVAETKIKQEAYTARTHI